MKEPLRIATTKRSLGSSAAISLASAAVRSAIFCSVKENFDLTRAAHDPSGLGPKFIARRDEFDQRVDDAGRRGGKPRDERRPLARQRAGPWAGASSRHRARARRRRASAMRRSGALVTRRRKLTIAPSTDQHRLVGALAEMRADIGDRQAAEIDRQADRRIEAARSPAAARDDRLARRDRSHGARRARRPRRAAPAIAPAKAGRTLAPLGAVRDGGWAKPGWRHGRGDQRAGERRARRSAPSFARSARSETGRRRRRESHRECDMKRNRSLQAMNMANSAPLQPGRGWVGIWSRSWLRPR